MALLYKNEVLENALQKHHEVSQRSENIQVTRFTILTHFPIDCTVRINHEKCSILNGDIQLQIYSDNINLSTFWIELNLLN